MESWVHGAAAVYHPFDERNVDIDGYGPIYIRPGIPENSYPKVVDLVFDFQWPLVSEEPPASGWALDEVLVRIRTFSQPDDEQETGIVWVSAYDREFRKVRILRDEPFTSPDRFRVLRFSAPKPSSYYFDPSSVFGPISVSLRVEGPGLALISGVGLALRPAIRWAWRTGLTDGANTSSQMDEQIVIDPDMTMADYNESIADPYLDPQPQAHPKTELNSTDS